MQKKKKKKNNYFDSNLISFFNDIKSYIIFKKNEKLFNVGFFSENKFIFQYLSKYVYKKAKKKKIALISFEKIELSSNRNIELFVFKTNFFRELLFLTLKLKLLYSSTPDLNNSLFKRSKFSKCKYIYLQHSPIGIIAGYNDDAFKSFDAVQAIHEYQYAEIKEISKKHNLKIKAFKGKYSFLENKNPLLIEESNVDVLIAPSWNTKFYELKCHILLSNLFNEKKISFFIRPHPMSIKKREVSLTELEDLNITVNTNKEINFNQFNFLVSDWSGIFIEYAFLKNRKSFLINTPRKLLNSSFKKFASKSIELEERENLANTYETDQLKRLVSDIENLRNNKIPNKISNYSKFKSKFYL